MSYFDGKRAAVTGAGSGIGRALAQALNAQGCALWLCDIDGDALAETAAALPRSELPCATTQVDVGDREGVSAWRDAVAAATDRLELLVNNAGVGLVAGAADGAIEDLRWLMDINFFGVVHGTQAFLPLLERAPRSHLVNLSSLFGLIGVPTQSAYNAAKFAVRGYSEALRQELAIAGSPIEVCCVHPGGVDTHIARNARSADPADTPEARAEAFRPFARTAPDAAAAQILRAAERGRPRLLLGRDARIAALIATLFPVRYPRLLGLHRAGGR
ncbi:MAG: SDR family NAD(P)-dependent oxidoreductase [Pseudohaliea sp.]